MKRFFAFSWGLMLGLPSVWAQVEVRVEPLIGKEAITAPVPVRVELRNHGVATRGALEWRLSDDILCLIPIELPPNARKQVELAVPVNAWQRTASKRRELDPVSDVPKLFWREAGKKGVRLPVPFNLNFHLPLVVIGDVQGGFEAWRRATYTLEYRFLG
ncbi:MAG: hypothetical protein NZ821_09880, partial [Gloeomargarita sp. SKYB31]|nr:hypothetical protein [Gloeomargarita sp. SKYB31]